MVAFGVRVMSCQEKGSLATVWCVERCVMLDDIHFILLEVMRCMIVVKISYKFLCQGGLC